MAKYALQRLILAIPTVIGLTLVIFFLVRVAVPVDAVDIASAASESVDVEREARLREEYGLSGSLPEQYIGWAGRMLTGDFGTSFFTGRSVIEEMKRRVPVSLQLGTGALLITLVIAIPVGLMSAARQDSLPDYIARGGAIMFYAVPGFWIATLVLVFGSIWLNWAPTIDYQNLWDDPVANLKQVWIPMVILGLSPIGTLTRLVRTQVLEVIRQDYVRTARAKGLDTRRVYFRHILRNSLLPIITVIGLQLPRLVAGTVIFEQIFVLPGVGRYLLDSVQRLDLYVIMATNLFFGMLLVLANIAVDLSYASIDPRIRLSRS